MARREFYPEIEPYATGMLRRRRPAPDLLGAVRQPQGRAGACSSMAAPAPAPARPIGASSIPAIIASSSSTSAAPAARKPLGEIADNTTPHLIADIEQLRSASRHRALAWCSAAPGARPWRSPMPRHIPSACKALVLRGIFLCRKSEIDWFLYGMRALRAGGLARLRRAICRRPSARDLLRDYYQRLIDPDPEVHMPAARAWSVYEGTCCTLLPSPETVRAFAQRHGGARARAHGGALLHQRHLPAGGLRC